MAITKLKKDNLGGVCTLLITKADSALKVPRILEGAITTPVLGAGGQKPAWEMIPFTEGTCTFQENEVLVKGTTAFQSVVQFELPGDDEDLAKNIARLERSRWLIEVEDLNGARRLVGTGAAPCIFSVLTRTTHGEPTQRPGRYCQLSTTSRLRCPIYTA
jgi:hypothetical protein